MEERKRLIAEIHAFLVKAAIMAVTLWVIFGVVFGVMPMKDQSMMPKLAAGDLLFAAANAMRLAGVDAEEALTFASKRFRDELLAPQAGTNGYQAETPAPIDRK